MKIFNDIDNLNKYIEQVVFQAMEVVNEEVKNLLIEHIENFYNEYSPKIYDRSYDLLYHAAIAVRPMFEGNKIVCEVYLDPNQLVQDGYHHQLDPQKIIEMASQGYHGTEQIRTNERFFENTVKELMQDEKHVKRLAERLKKRGLFVDF